MKASDWKESIKIKKGKADQIKGEMIKRQVYLNSEDCPLEWRSYICLSDCKS